MPFELSRRYARLPRRLRVCLDLLAAALVTALVLAVFALVGQGPGVFQPVIGAWTGGWMVSLGLFAVLAIGTAVLGNAAYERFHAWETARLPSVREFFDNHDLARLVGQSIGMSLRACEADLPDGDARILRRLALRAERDWPVIAQSKRVRRWLAKIRDNRLLAFIRDPSRLALTDEQSAVLLELLHPDGLEQAPAFADPASGALVRERLSRRFSEALRQALKRDFARRGEAAFGLLLDIAGELLNQGAAALPRTAENQAAVAQAVRVTRSLDLSVPRNQAAAMRSQIAAQADQLDAAYRAVRAEGRASARRDRVTHGSLALVAALVLGVGLPSWYWQHRTRSSVETGQQATEQHLAAIEAQLRAALTPKLVGEDPTQRQLPPELLAKARELLERGNREQQAVAEIALKHHTEADGIIQELKREPLAEAYRLLKLEGDNWYNAREFDRAIQPYEQALALRPEDPDVRINAAIAHSAADLGDISGHRQRALEILTGTLALMPAGSSGWAITQHNLGNVWTDLPTGDRGENFGKAIAAYNAALEVYTRQAHPVEWARTQNSLALAWANLPTGDQAENLGKAIGAYTAVLKVLTRQAHPADWAMIQHNLGAAWEQLPTGDRRENVRKAIAAYTAAQQVRTRQVDPMAWAATQYNLGVAWAKMPTGDRRESLGKAIAFYIAALEVYTRQAHPVDWAMTQESLGEAWRNMPTDYQGKNLDNAIAALSAALEVYTRQAHPLEWAVTQANLGSAWQDMPIGDRGENLAKAINAYSAALEVYTRRADPMFWAPIQNNLGLAWMVLPTGVRGDNLGKAINAYVAALEVYTRQTDPMHWAAVRCNLGLAYEQRAQSGGGRRDLEAAIAEVRAAAGVFTEAAFPFGYRQQIAPTLAELRTAWDANGYGTPAEFDAIPPAPEAP